MRTCRYIFVLMAVLAPFCRGVLARQGPQSATARSFRVLRMTGRSTTARPTPGMERDWCGNAARRRAKRVGRGATMKKESGWIRDAAASLLWGAAMTAVMPAPRMVEGR